MCLVISSMWTAFHPSSDGLTERQTRTIGEMPRQFVNSHRGDWDQQLLMVKFAMNHAINLSVQSTAFMLNYGMHPLDRASLKDLCGPSV